MLCDGLTYRITGAPERNRRQALNPTLYVSFTSNELFGINLALCRSEETIFVFLEQYFEQLESPVAIQVWPRFLQLAKEIATSWREYKLQVYPTLR